MSDSGDFLDSAEGEVSLFRSIMRTRPVGIHRHVHILAIHNSIYRDTGFKVPMQDIWAKLGRMYDLDVLEHGVSLLFFYPPKLCGIVDQSRVLWSWLTPSFLDSLHHTRRSLPAKIPTLVQTPQPPTKTS